MSRNVLFRLLAVVFVSLSVLGGGQVAGQSIVNPSPTATRDCATNQVTVLFNPSGVVGASWALVNSEDDWSVEGGTNPTTGYFTVAPGEVPSEPTYGAFYFSPDHAYDTVILNLNHPTGDSSENSNYEWVTYTINLDPCDGNGETPGDGEPIQFTFCDASSGNTLTMSVLDAVNQGHIAPPRVGEIFFFDSNDYEGPCDGGGDSIVDVWDVQVVALQCTGSFDITISHPDTVQAGQRIYWYANQGDQRITQGTIDVQNDTAAYSGAIDASLLSGEGITITARHEGQFTGSSQTIDCPVNDEGNGGETPGNGEAVENSFNLVAAQRMCADQSFQATWSGANITAIEFAMSNTSDDWTSGWLAADPAAGSFTATVDHHGYDRAAALVTFADGTTQQVEINTVTCSETAAPAPVEPVVPAPPSTSEGTAGSATSGSSGSATTVSALPSTGTGPFNNASALIAVAAVIVLGALSLLSRYATTQKQ